MMIILKISCLIIVDHQLHRFIVLGVGAMTFGGGLGGESLAAGSA